jgi:hypothetical protein
MKKFFQRIDFQILLLVGIFFSLSISAILIPNFDSFQLNSTILKKLKPSIWFLLLIPLYISYRLLENNSNKEKFFLILLFSIFTIFCVDIHFTNVDILNYFPDKLSILWQIELHEKIMSHDPEVIPHSYRFLANAFITVLLTWNKNHLLCFLIYRFIFQFLLLFSIFYWARLYSSRNTSLLTVLLYLLVYPITIRFYAGQPIDPLSHLCFILSFIFLEKKQDLYFILTILIGILAKESILLMPIVFFIYRDKNINNLVKTFIFLLLSTILILLIRFLITNNQLEYKNISGVTPKHILDNWNDGLRWYRQFFSTIVLLLPLTILEWKNSNRILKILILFLGSFLILSNLIFSWLTEARNFVPFLVPMCLLNAMYLTKDSKSL